ncbi:hypothetical protein FCR2A7T_29260 [Flavobacterium cauense R2A-7]|uniref:Uncharacterized protein n=1 Tax=Flavobacterium cauense R2A-7 TaxID=1341154 RepID=V6RVW5_9FLAO|nr:hypothetical protein [Flavobacterium cauense]ESU18626.1 hypothetical protein FCR2A7T_29260 [Flavobacterium cauense R2A-7]KGO80713.1 hypothetical protein Q762_11565 [Flavobacterium cauense R2A-7]TWI11862.1 hypothetical protein IP98_02033 [Flavobacterium cauense R2A-7]
MKKSIIYLGIAVILFSNVISALNCQQSFNNENLSLTQNIQSIENTDATIGKNSTGGGGDTSSVISDEIVVNPYQKTMEEIIAENNQIIESDLPNEVTETTSEEDEQIRLSIISVQGPVYTEKTTEEIIMEDRQIIESPVFNEIPLYAIKKSSKS